METYQIILLIITSIVVLSVGIWYIITYLTTPQPDPKPKPDPNGGGGKPKGNNWPRSKEVFFISITASTDVVDKGNTVSGGTLNTYNVAQELKPAFFKRHYFYNIASMTDIKYACQQGFNPPGASSTVKSGQLFSQTFDPTNIMLMTIQPFDPSNAKSWDYDEYSGDVTKYIGTGQVTAPTSGFGSSLQNNLQIVPSGKAYSIIPSTTGDTTTYCGPGSSTFTNCFNTGPQITSPLYLKSSKNCPNTKNQTSQSITYPVIGYKPSQDLNTTNSNQIFQSTFIDPSLTADLSLEIVPYSPDSWYYQPNDPSGKVYYTGGMELMVFKIDTTKVETTPGNPGYFQIWQGTTGSHGPPNLRAATLDDLEYSFSKGYNRSEYIIVSAIIANVVTDKSNPAKYGVNLYQLGATIPPFSSLPYSSGQYSGTVLNSARNDFVNNMPGQNPQITFDACNNPQPQMGQYKYEAYWGIKPDQTTWAQTLLSPKAQTLAPTYIDLLPFTEGSTNWLTKMFTGTVEKWSMYS